MTDTTHNELTLDQLRARREKQGLSVAEMANRIKVSREIIHFIEQGEFNRIGSATFIRGHVGNYARELALDPDTVIALVPAQHLKPYEPKLSSSKVSNPLSRVKTHSSGFGRYVLGTFLVAALGLSFYFVYDKWDNSQPEDDYRLVENNSNVPINDAKRQKKVIYSSLLPQADLAEQNSESDDSPQDADENNESDIMSEGFDAGDDNTDSQTEDQIDSVPQPQTAETDRPVSEEQPRFNIRFDLSNQAWVSIKTQSGEKVVSDLIGPGERQYSADEPIHFRIGNADQLSLFINEEQVDLSQNTRQNVADFDWPPEEG